MSLWYIILTVVLTLALPIVEKRVKSEVQEEDDALDVMEEPEMEVADEEAEEVEADYQYLVQPGIPEPVKVPAPAVVQVAEEPAAAPIAAAQPATVQPATVQPAIAQQTQCLEKAEEKIGKKSSLKERLKSNPEDMILLSEILRPKYKEY